MPDTAAESLHALVARSQERVTELRRAGDLVALLAGAKAAADDIERRVGESLDDEARQALIVVKRITFNAAADCWPGWAVSDKPADTGNLLAGLELAQRSIRITKKLGLGSLQEGTGTWLCGAFDLALARYTDASNNLAVARQHYIAGEAPGLVLLTEGYIAILRQVAGNQTPADGEDFPKIIAKIEAGGFEDGAEWIEQLRTAQKVFVRRDRL